MNRSNVKRPDFVDRVPQLLQPHNIHISKHFGKTSKCIGIFSVLLSRCKAGVQL